MYRTGFCQIGCHEGTKPRSASGKPMKVCVGFAECQCDCHAKITKMYAMADVPRVDQPNPEYIPAPNVDLSWLMDRDFDDTPGLNPGKASRFVTPEPISLVTIMEASYTAEVNVGTGYRKSGSLEQQVLDVCKRFLNGELDSQATPKAIALAIDPIRPPSVGAIGAVFDRWTAYGFAVINKGPVRFMMFTAAGMQFGLEKMRHDYKRMQRFSSSKH